MDDDLTGLIKSSAKQGKVSTFVILAGLAFSLYRIDSRVSELQSRLDSLESEVRLIKVQNARINDKIEMKSVDH